MTTPATWLPAPQPYRDPSLPARVTVYEVGPRDGLQAEPEILPAHVKIELGRRLLAAGIRDLEVTSFVPPRWVPQLADAEEVAAGIGAPDGVRTVALVPNLRGFERALQSGFRHVAVVVSATESFARANLNASRDEAIERAEQVQRAAAERGVPVRAYVSMAFGDPWEGPVEPDLVADIARRLHAAGAATVAIGDTIGTGTPAHVAAVLQRVVDAGVSLPALALHLHDTYGQALANVLEALRFGVTEFDSSAGGLGRCPYARGATGNLGTEDLVWMLHSLGIETGIDLDAVVATSAWMSQVLGRPVPSKVATALIAARA